MFDNSHDARLNEDSEARGTGATVRYRAHMRDSQPGLVDKHGRQLHQKSIPPTLFNAANYVLTKLEDCPPLFQVMKRMEAGFEAVSPNQAIFENKRFVTFQHWHHYKVDGGKYCKLLCFFTGDTAFFLEFNFLLRKLRLSCDYTSGRARQLATMYAEERVDRIRWIMVQDDAPISSSPPPLTG